MLPLNTTRNSAWDSAWDSARDAAWNAAWNAYSERLKPIENKHLQWTTVACNISDSINDSVEHLIELTNIDTTWNSVYDVIEVPFNLAPYDNSWHSLIQIIEN